MTPNECERIVEDVQRHSSRVTKFLNAIGNYSVSSLSTPAFGVNSTSTSQDGIPFQTSAVESLPGVVSATGCEDDGSGNVNNLAPIASDRMTVSNCAATKTNRLLIECCDCSRLEGTMQVFPRAFFSAPHIDEEENSTEVPKIVLCADKLNSANEVESALSHELVHAFDHCVSRLDLTDCSQLACSEIRAAEACECSDVCNSWLDNLLGSNNQDKCLTWDPRLELCKWRKRRCVANTAKLSVEAVFPGQGGEMVTRMMSECYLGSPTKE